MLFNIHKGKWDAQLLKTFNVPKQHVTDCPIVHRAKSMARQSCSGGSIPIAGIAGDQQAALFGQCCTKPGMVKNTYGTGCFMLMNTGTEPVASKNRAADDGCMEDRRSDRVRTGRQHFHRWCSRPVAARRTWVDSKLFRRGAACGTGCQTLDGVYLVPAFAGLGAPHWDAYARGTLVGMTRGTNKSHIARAASGRDRLPGW